jgi:hypothetical protein
MTQTFHDCDVIKSHHAQNKRHFRSLSIIFWQETRNFYQHSLLYTRLLHPEQREESDITSHHHKKTMRRTPSISVAAMLYAVLFALILARTSVLMVVAQEEGESDTATATPDVTADEGTPIPTLACQSICAAEGQQIQNPDATVTYDWNKRVPVPSSTVGETVQTFTCAEFDLRLTTFDENDCARHQQGLQEAGCVCGSGSGAVSGTVFSAVTILVAMATSAAML